MPGSRKIRKTTSELEADLGTQIRRLRQQARLTQAEVARDAGISTSTLHTLEHGRGSSVATLVSVLRVLRREDWLAALAPAADDYSPRAAHRAAMRSGRQRR